MGDVIRMSYFNLGPTVSVPEDLCVPFRHPGAVKKDGLLTCRESFHEFLPSRPGEHGILYLDRPDLPQYIVPLHPLPPPLPIPPVLPSFHTLLPFCENTNPQKRTPKTSAF
jgi:hypothetical protein